MLRNLKFRHDDGGTMDMIQVLVGILAIAFILLMNISTTSAAAKRSRIEVIAHEYILRMESEGCLTDTLKQELISDLENNGVENISISATTRSVHYGDKISLTIRGTLVTPSYKYDSRNFTLVKTDANIRISVAKKSVSRHTD